jgi:3-deoxy-manno-octulosonate cytidylyltransferase (CMP-KDO synthetase)
LSAPEKWVSPKFTSANPVYRHLGLYGYTADFLAAFSTLESGALEGTEKLEQLRAMEHGYPIHVGFTDQPTIGIDTPEDIAAFEQALA